MARPLNVKRPAVALIGYAQAAFTEAYGLSL
jgi:hypothetical protein